MPLRQPRFIHVQTPYGKLRGFSTHFFSIADEPNMVGYQVAMCSKDDHFCKRTAREVCIAAPVKTCRVVDFPGVLAQLDATCYRDMIDPLDMRSFSNRYAWVWKYFL